MKTKAVNKKGKKPLSETSPAKPGQKQKNAIKSKKDLKKPKLADSVRNGKLTNKIKEQAFKEIADQKQKQTKKTKQQNNTEPSKQEIKTQIKQEPKINIPKVSIGTTTTTDDKKLKFQAKRALQKNKLKQGNLSTEQLKSRIEAITSRKVLSKTAKRKLAIFNRRLKVMGSGTILEEVEVEKKSNKKDNRQEVAKNKQEAKEKLDNEKAKEELEEDEDDSNSDEDQIDEEEEEAESMDIDDTDEEESDDDESEEFANEMEISKMVNNEKKKEKKVTVGNATIGNKQKNVVVQNKKVGALIKAGKPLAGGVQQKKKPVKKGKQNVKA